MVNLLNSDFTYSYRVNTTAKQLPNFSSYIILPNEGLIWSKKSNRFIGNKLSNGYYHTTLTDDNGKENKGYLHRFIYTACYGPIPEGLQVNHIDENKSNNSIFNLNLMTPIENANFGTRNERVAKALSKPVGAFLNGELKFTFSSTREAGRNGFDQGAVCNCCRGVKGYKTYKGYEWEFLENLGVN